MTEHKIAWTDRVRYWITKPRVTPRIGKYFAVIFLGDWEWKWGWTEDANSFTRDIGPIHILRNKSLLEHERFWLREFPK